MEFVEAYKTLVKRSVERNTKEIPAILSCLDFENLDCLEIGSGPEARIASKLAGFAKHITCLEKEADNIVHIKAITEYLGIDKKISPIYFPSYDKDNLPFPDKKFDVIIGAWLPHKLVTSQKFLEEVTRISRRYVLFVMPGIKGDEPKLVSLVRRGEMKRRREYKQKISGFLSAAGFKVSSKEEILRLVFKDPQEINDVFYCMAFKNEPLGKKQEKVDSFLKKIYNKFADGFYIIIGERIR